MKPCGTIRKSSPCHEDTFTSNSAYGGFNSKVKGATSAGPLCERLGLLGIVYVVIPSYVELPPIVTSPDSVDVDSVLQTQGPSGVAWNGGPVKTPAISNAMKGVGDVLHKVIKRIKLLQKTD